jgi:ABC-type transport system involved in multi-copper enzyme maturation permease subunit
MLRLGLTPSGDDALRLFTWYVMTVVYVGFWLSLSMLCSVLFRNSGTAFFAVLAVWLLVLALLVRKVWGQAKALTRELVAAQSKLEAAQSAAGSGQTREDAGAPA